MLVWTRLSNLNGARYRVHKKSYCMGKGVEFLWKETLQVVG